MRYGQAMRVHRHHRGHGYAHWVRSLPWAIGINRPTQVQYDYIRARNMTMERWNRKFMPKVETVPERDDDVPGVPVTVLQYPARPRTVAAAGIRTARPDDIEHCVALINRTHGGRDLFRPYTHEFLTDRLAVGFPDAGPDTRRPVYCMSDLHVLEQDGEVIACAGMWDRGRDLRERWRHRDTGEERVTSVAALLDIGFAEGREHASAALVQYLIGAAHALGRDYLVAPLEAMPQVSVLLARHDPVPETRYLQWRAETPAINAPTYLDLVYW